MKTHFAILFLLFGLLVYAQSNYTVVLDTDINRNVYDGYLHNTLFKHNSLLFKEINTDSSYVLDPLLINALKTDKYNKIKIVIVGGIWWCPDSRDILSKLVLYTDTTQFQNIDFYSVNRNKKSRNVSVVKQYKIKYVPTIIVYKNEKEIGRVVEYGKMGHWEKELTNILLKVKK